MLTHDHAESPSPLGINEEQGRDCRNNLNGAVTQRSIQRFHRRVTCIDENRRAVEGDDVDSTPSRVSITSQR